MKCYKCGAELTDDTRFCSYCGVEIKPKSELGEPVLTEESNHDFCEASETPTPSIPTQKKKGKIGEFWSKLSAYGRVITIGICVFALLFFAALMAGKVLACVLAGVGLALVIVALLMKRQIIKTPKPWLHFVALALGFAMLFPYSGAYKVDYGGAERFEWSRIILGDVLPQPKVLFGEVNSNMEGYLSLDIYKVDRTDYDAYVAECKAFGYTIDASEADTYYYAFNSDGYKLSLNYYTSKKEMYIGVDAADEYEEIMWPSVGIGSLLPAPNSFTGEITRDDEKGFDAYVSDISIDEFKNYTNSCAAAGFSVEAHKDGKHYTAKNADGYRLSVAYQGNNVIYVSIDEPEYKIAVEVKCVENWFLSKYDVEVYVDDAYEGIITHGGTETFELVLTKGSYKVKFVNEKDDSVTGSATIDVKKAETLEYEITCHSSNIAVKGPSTDEGTVPTEPTETTESTEPTEPEDAGISMVIDSSAYAGKTASKVESEFKEMGFTNVIVKPVVTGDTTKVDGQVTSVSANEQSFKAGDSFATDATINIYCWEVDESLAEKRAFIRKMSNYSLVYIFDAKTKQVVYFGTQDTYVEKGSYKGDFNSGVTITWEHGQWTEKLTSKAGSSVATLVDGNGFDWEYEVCDVVMAQNMLDQLQ